MNSCGISRPPGQCFPAVPGWPRPWFVSSTRRTPTAANSGNRPRHRRGNPAAGRRAAAGRSPRPGGAQRRFVRTLNRRFATELRFGRWLRSRVFHCALGRFAPRHALRPDYFRTAVEQFFRGAGEADSCAPLGIGQTGGNAFLLRIHCRPPGPGDGERPLGTIAFARNRPCPGQTARRA